MHHTAAGTRSKATIEELKERNKKAYESRRKKLDALLPVGWKRVESRSRPGEYVYENEYTEERIAWFPTEPAKRDGKCVVCVVCCACVVCVCA